MNSKVYPKEVIRAMEKDFGLNMFVAIISTS